MLHETRATGVLRRLTVRLVSECKIGNYAIDEKTNVGMKVVVQGGREAGHAAIL